MTAGSTKMGSLTDTYDPSDGTSCDIIPLLERRIQVHLFGFINYHVCLPLCANLGTSMLRRPGNDHVIVRQHFLLIKTARD